MDAADVAHGSCNCGAIQYTLSRKPIAVATCHCKNCQRQSGSAFSVNLVVKADAMKVEGALSDYEDKDTESGIPVVRQFCGSCGSPIRTIAGSMPGFYAVKAGTLDDPAPFAPTVQIWTCSAIPWVELPKGQPAFEKGPTR